MLIQLDIENFRSIKDKVSFSMLASKDKSHENNLIKEVDASGKEIDVLKTSAIYGANGSGKTNVLEAFSFITYLLSTSNDMQKGKKIPVDTFKLEREYMNKPSSFDMIFKTKGIKYAYGFSVTETKVVDEYLYSYPNSRQTVIFERENTDEYTFKNDKEKQTQIKDKFHSDNKLFISTLSVWEYEKAQEPFYWLRDNLRIIDPRTNTEEFTINKILKNSSINMRIKNTLNKVIEGIEDIKINEVEIDSKDLPLLKFLNEEAKEKILKNNEKLTSVSVFHKMNDSDELVEFDLGDESDGTQKLFGLLGIFIDILDTGSTLVVDELDVRLHSHLTKFLVELFHNPEINKNNAQLIFSTHDTNLLDQDIFRRDQIWFTEKKEDKSTDLYSLDDFRVRKDAAIEKGYLQGKYGAIPHLGGGNIWE